MPVVRIGDSTWDRLKQWAEPLEDSPDDVLRKVLDMADEHLRCRSHTQPSPDKVKGNGAAKSKRGARGQKVPEMAYESPILETLYEMGGRGQMNEVLSVVERKMKHLFGDFDYQMLPSGGDIRWRNTAAWRRLNLVKRGLLKDDSEWGVWELTEQGVKAVEDKRG